MTVAVALPHPDERQGRPQRCELCRAHATRAAVVAQLDERDPARARSYGSELFGLGVPCEQAALLGGAVPVCIEGQQPHEGVPVVARCGMHGRQQLQLEAAQLHPRTRQHALSLPAAGAAGVFQQRCSLFAL